MTTPLRPEPDPIAQRRRAAWADLYLQPDYPALAEPPVPESLRRAAAQLGRLVGEVLAGARPAQQLAGWLDELSNAQLGHWLMRHRGIRVQLAGVRFGLLANGHRLTSLRYLVANRSVVVLVEWVPSARCWHLHDLDIALPGPTPAGVMPRWGYDHGRA